MIKTFIIILSILVLGATGYFTANKFSAPKTQHKVGEAIDSLNGIYVYYNGSVGNVSGRNITADNYNLGLKYQCVEFVKRYYYQHLNHKMPDTYGHAKDYFDPSLSDGEKNTKRNLTQYTNGSTSKPKQGDIVVLAPTVFNQYGHVAIVAKVTDNKVEVIQQNPGPFSSSREVYKLDETDGKWTLKNDRVYGWLRKN